MKCKHTRKARRCRFFIVTFGAKRFSVPLQIILCFAAITATVMACGWPGTEHSVRFNGYRDERDLGRLPPLPRYPNSKNTGPFTRYEEEEYEEENRRIKEIDELWQEAADAQERGDLIAARSHLRDYLARTATEQDSRRPGPDDMQKRRNSAIDRLDALTALDKGSSVFAVRSYLAARLAYESDKPAEEVRSTLAASKADKNLADNALYLEAALLYRDGRETAQQAFDLLADRYQRSEKREAALYMAAVALMKQSKSYQNAKEHGSGAPLCDECRDGEWRQAGARFERLIREYPLGRYSVDARGWLGYLAMAVGDRAGALVHYYRLLGSEDESAQFKAVTSLRLLRRRAVDSEMAEVEAQLESEPAAALAYAYHNVYNFAFGKLNDWEASETDRENNQRAELERISAFCARLMRRYPNMSVGGGFALRLAEADLEIDRDEEAAKLARRALASSLRGDDRAQALWVAGVAEHRLGRYAEARQALSALVNEYPNSQLYEGARRYLAMVAEDMGDMDGALEQYLALNYRLDVAYFVDVLMTPEELAGFIERHPKISRRDELLYALGVRYLRERKWNEARETLMRVRTLGRGVDDSYLYTYYRSAEEQNQTPKEPWLIDHRIRGVRSQWIERDLKTADDLERMEKEVESAEGDEAKAEALYQIASYEYQGTLLFYNTAAWGGARYHNLCFLDEAGYYRRPNEARLLFEHMQQHDRAARALTIYLDVVKRFPKTRAARDALYTAAVCHVRLADYNDYWRGVYSVGGHAGDRLVTYEDVKAAYPDYQLPRGTYGWEPSTRTVNGGPGWKSPPKPRPRPSRRERLLKLITASALGVWERGTGILQAAFAWTVRLYEYLWIGFAFSGLLFLWGEAAQARRLLRSELARFRPRPRASNDEARLFIADAPAISRLDHYLSHEKRDQWREYSLEAIYRLKQLAGDRSGRAAMVLNAGTHGLFIVLLLKLL